MTILVTGGAGFIGSNFIIKWNSEYSEKIINLDCLNYASNKDNLSSLNSSKYEFIKGDINNQKLVINILKKHKIRKIINFAAETHVDRSIKNASNFIRTNINGTFNMLEATKYYFYSLNNNRKSAFRFLHVSTDEVFGSLNKLAKPSNETSPMKPNNPYSASKASSDHLVRAYNKTYNLPTIISNCTNNYGPFQFPEKLIPLIISNAINEKKLPIYGNGKQIRDWLYVEDHCNALIDILEKGEIGNTYNIGGNSEITNLDLVKKICKILDKIIPRNKGKYSQLISFVKDRPGHDQRYSLDISKIRKKLKWKPIENLDTGLNRTINWYLKNHDWLKKNTNNNFRKWIKEHYK